MQTQPATLQPLKERRFSKQNIKAFLKSDRAILMICISIAFVFWLITKLSYSYKDTIVVNLEYETPTNKVFTFPPAKQLEVDIEGKGWDLLSLTFSGEKRIIAIDVGENEQRTISALSLNNRVIKFVPRVDILNIYPESIQLQTEEIATKKIPVVLVHQIKLAPLFQLKDSISIQPRFIEIKGPASVIQSINEWKTNVLVPKGDLNKNTNFQIDLKPHYNGSVVCSVKQIKGTISIEEVTEKELEIPIQILNAPDDLLLVILPKKITVSCRVGLSHYASLSADDFVAVVDFEHQNFYEKSAVRVLLKEKPDFVKQVQYSPKKVDYIVRNKKLD